MRSANCRLRDALRIDAVVASQGRARVAEAETIGAQDYMLSRHPAADEIGDRAHIIARRDDRAADVDQALLHPALAQGIGVFPVPALAFEAVAAQLGDAGDAPDIGGDASPPRMSTAVSASRRMVPEPGSWTRGPFFAPARAREDSRNGYIPRLIPSSAPTGTRYKSAEQRYVPTKASMKAGINRHADRGNVDKTARYIRLYRLRWKDAKKPFQRRPGSRRLRGHGGIYPRDVMSHWWQGAAMPRSASA